MAKTGQIIRTQVDIENVEKALIGTSKNLKAVGKSVLRIAAKETSKRVTGELAKAYVYKVKRDGSEANVFPKALTGKDKTIFPKAMTLSYGHDGPTKRAASWHIAPRGFVQSGQQYAESGAYMTEVQKMVDKELEKYWG